MDKKEIESDNTLELLPLLAELEDAMPISFV